MNCDHQKRDPLKRMYKNQLKLVLVLLILLSTISITEAKSEDSKLIFVPTNDLIEKINIDPILDEIGQEGFNTFLVERTELIPIIMTKYSDVETLKQTVEQGGNYEKREAKSLLYTYLVEKQVEDFKKSTGDDSEVIILYHDIDSRDDTAKQLSDEIREELKGNIDPKLLIATYNLFAFDEKIIKKTPEEVSKIVTSDTYKQYDNGDLDESSISEDELNQIRNIHEAFKRARRDLNRKSESYPPNTFLRAVPDTYYDLEREIFEEQYASILKRSNLKIDPGKDVTVRVSGASDDQEMVDENSVNLARAYTEHNDITLFFGADLYIDTFILGHEWLHLKNYCDVYNYQFWKDSNEDYLQLTGQGCVNKYDDVGCCEDNPRWNQDGQFLEQEYLNHIENLGVGRQCLPKVCEGKVELKFDKSFGVGTYLCIGNPCDASNPQGCWDVMAKAFRQETLDLCFDGKDPSRKVLKPKEKEYYDSG